MIDLNQIWVECKCPNCDYGDVVQLVDVRTEKIIFCNNCKVDIQLVDSEASTHNSHDKIQNSLKNLENTLKNFGK